MLSSFSALTLRDPKLTEYYGSPILNIMPSIMIDNPFFLIVNNILAFFVVIPYFICARPKIVVLSVPPASQVFGTLFLSRLFRAKIVIDYRDQFEDYSISHTKKHSFFYHFLKKVLAAFYKKCHLILPVSNRVERTLNDRGVLNTYTTYDGVDTKTFSKMSKKDARNLTNISDKKFVIVFLGWLYDAYRVDCLINALNILKNKNPENANRFLLLIVGGGEVEELVEQIQRCDVREMVRFEGVVEDKKKIVTLLNSADLGVIPYDDNPLWMQTHPTKLFEYAACGLPVIGMATHDSVLARLIESNSLGAVVPPLDSVTFAHTVELLAKEPTKLDYLSIQCLIFGKKYDKKPIADDLLAQILR